MQNTIELFMGLLSQDPDVYDATYDHILFSEKESMNVDIMNMMKHFVDNERMLCSCIQLLSFRATHTRGRHPT